MIRPNKFTAPNNCVVYNGYRLLKILKQNKIIKTSELYKQFILQCNNEVEIMFEISLNFLFLMGILNYHAEIDELELKL